MFYKRLIYQTWWRQGRSVSRCHDAATNTASIVRWRYHAAGTTLLLTTTAHCSAEIVTAKQIFAYYSVCAALMCKRRISNVLLTSRRALYVCTVCTQYTITRYTRAYIQYMAGFGRWLLLTDASYAVPANIPNSCDDIWSSVQVM